MTATSPEWLTRRAGMVQPNATSSAYLVYFAGEPQYLLMPVPAEGTFACRVTQTINGRRLDAPGVYPTPAAAVTAGLDHLRHALGW